jgi:hypothetical protein
MATGSHLFAYGPPGWPFWARAMLYWVAPYGVGSALIFARRDAIISRLQASGSSEEIA